MFRFTTLATFYERLYMYINVYDTLLLEKKQVARIGYNEFLFLHEYSTVVKELRSKMFGQYPGYFKAVFLKQTRIIIVSIYKYTVYIMF